MSEEVILPEEATVPLPPPDREKEIAMMAAVNVDRWREEREKVAHALEQAIIATQVKDVAIATLEETLAVERKRFDELYRTHMEVIQDNADLQAILASTQAHHENEAARLARFEFSRLRSKRRNGNKRNGPSGPPPDTIRSEGEMAVASAVLSDDQPSAA